MIVNIWAPIPNSGTYLNTNMCSVGLAHSVTRWMMGSLDIYNIGGT